MDGIHDEESNFEQLSFDKLHWISGQKLFTYQIVEFISEQMMYLCLSWRLYVDEIELAKKWIL